MVADQVDCHKVTNWHDWQLTNQLCSWASTQDATDRCIGLQRDLCRRRSSQSSWLLTYGMAGAMLPGDQVLQLLQPPTYHQVTRLPILTILTIYWIFNVEYWILGVLGCSCKCFLRVGWQRVSEKTALHMHVRRHMYVMYVMHCAVRSTDVLRCTVRKCKCECKSV